MRNEELPPEAQNKIVVFAAKRIRRTWHEKQWFFSVVDVVAALTDSADPKQYIKKMRQRDPELDSYWGTVCTPLDLPAPDGKISSGRPPRPRSPATAMRRVLSRIKRRPTTAAALPGTPAGNWSRNLVRRSLPARIISRTSPGPHCPASKKIRHEILRAWRPPGQ